LTGLTQDPARHDAGRIDRWVDLDIETAIARLGKAWTRLSDTAEAPPTADPLWQRIYWRAFQDHGGDVRVHALCADDGVAAIVPVRLRGRILRQWASDVNAHAPYRTFLLARAPHVAARVLDHLMSSAHMLDLGPASTQAPETDALVSAAQWRKLRVARDASGADAVVDLPSSWAELRQLLSPKLVGNTRRALRHLRDEGQLDFAIVTGGEQLERALEECFALETLGWKGRHGSPIRSSPDTLQFYSELADDASSAGRFALYTLRLNGALIAFEYCLRHNGRLDLLKQSYHPSFGRHSPGNVLRVLLLQHEIAAGEISSYHIGLVSEWKQRWATRLEPRCHVRIYDPGVRGTLAYLVKSWLPAAARRQPAVRATARWLLERLRQIGFLMLAVVEFAC
jgi:CelD/BcsL family acetyltransferase involved in cellulose biosynthesis